MTPALDSAGLLTQEPQEALTTLRETSAATASDDLRALQAIVEGTARGTGQEFFQSLVRHLAKAIISVADIIGR